MNREQIYKLLKVCLVATAFMLVFEIIFSIDSINTFFSSLITKTDGIWVYFVLWLIMFLQVTILNIPAYSILSISISIGLDVFEIEYLLTVISAYMCGCILAYWLGRWFGVKAVKWCAGSQEDFDKWSSFINTKGKWWYFLTILFPIFPDDLLCLVAGSTKFHFGRYTLFNLIGRSIGLITMLATLKLIGIVGGGFPFMIIVWAIAFALEIVGILIIKKKLSQKIDNK